MRRGIAALALALGACVQAPVDGPPMQDSVVPGTIGIAVRQERSQVVVAAVGKSSPAEKSGVRVGDVVQRYNGEAVASPRQFYRLVFESPPGSMARLEVMRESKLRTLKVPVRELDLMPRV